MPLMKVLLTEPENHRIQALLCYSTLDWRGNAAILWTCNSAHYSLMRNPSWLKAPRKAGGLALYIAWMSSRDTVQPRSAQKVFTCTSSSCWRPLSTSLIPPASNSILPVASEDTSMIWNIYFVKGVFAMLLVSYPREKLKGMMGIGQEAVSVESGISEQIEF